MDTHPIASKTLQFLLQLVRVTLWRSALRLPWALISSVAPVLIVALFSWHLSTAPEASAIVGYLTFPLWAVCFAVAGTIWGLHRAFYDAMHDGIQLCKERGTDAAAALLEPLVEKLPQGKKEYQIDEVRQQWIRWADQPSCRLENLKWYSFMSRLANWMARKWLAAQLAVVKGTLDELEDMGEKTVSLASLKNYVVERSASTLAQAARQGVRNWSLGAAALIFVLMVGPPAVSLTVVMLSK
jgi:hypothetical protein